MPQNLTSIDEKRRTLRSESLTTSIDGLAVNSCEASTPFASGAATGTFLVITLSTIAVLSMPTAAHAWIFGIGDAVWRSLHHPALWNLLAMWNTDIVLPLLAGIGFACAACRYSKGGACEQLVFLGFGSLFSLGMGLTLESYVDHAGTGNARRVALSTAISYVSNVLLPMFALNQSGAMALHRRSAWTRKLMAGAGALMVSGILHYAQTTIIQTYGL